MRPSLLHQVMRIGAPQQSPPQGLATKRCAVCRQGCQPGDSRRFGGRRVCLDCWQGLARTERAWAYRSFNRPSLLALFTAEVAVRG